MSFQQNPFVHDLILKWEGVVAISPSDNYYHLLGNSRSQTPYSARVLQLGVNPEINAIAVGLGAGAVFVNISNDRYVDLRG